MALITTRDTSGPGLVAGKFPLCHTCRERKPGLFGVDNYGKPRCGDCSALIGRPIPGHPPIGVIPHG